MQLSLTIKRLGMLLSHRLFSGWRLSYHYGYTSPNHYCRSTGTQVPVVFTSFALPLVLSFHTSLLDNTVLSFYFYLFCFFNQWNCSRISIFIPSYFFSHVPVLLLNRRHLKRHISPLIIIILFFAERRNFYRRKICSKKRHPQRMALYWHVRFMLLFCFSLEHDLFSYFEWINNSNVLIPNFGVTATKVWWVVNTQASSIKHQSDNNYYLKRMERIP